MTWGKIAAFYCFTSLKIEVHKMLINENSIAHLGEVVLYNKARINLQLNYIDLIKIQTKCVV